MACISRIYRGRNSCTLSYLQEWAGFALNAGAEEGTRPPNLSVNSGITLRDVAQTGDCRYADDCGGDLLLHVSCSTNRKCSRDQSGTTNFSRAVVATSARPWSVLRSTGPKMHPSSGGLTDSAPMIAEPCKRQVNAAGEPDERGDTCRRERR
jgi:hypothetical protein